jgi:hypothetical protein
MFIYASGWDATPFTSTYERLRNDRGWTVKSLPTGHDIFGQAPNDFLAFVQELRSVVAE